MRTKEFKISILAPPPPPPKEKKDQLS